MGNLYKLTAADRSQYEKLEENWVDTNAISDLQQALSSSTTTFFNYIENEAQLAFLLSHEIAHATQEHSLRALNHKKKTRTWLKVGAIASYAMEY